MATEAEMRAKAQAIAASGIASTQTDGRSVTVAKPGEILDAADRVKTVSNAWGRVARAKFIPGSTVDTEGSE